ncbi:hypothetical protein E4T56_gene7285 [Termitomyces sp. T112]|nr:hypothetical protein E4T56_gene7285 [Termitomyces sp. T112]
MPQELPHSSADSLPTTMPSATTPAPTPKEVLQASAPAHLASRLGSAEQETKKTHASLPSTLRLPCWPAIPDGISLPPLPLWPPLPPQPFAAPPPSVLLMPPTSPTIPAIPTPLITAL